MDGRDDRDRAERLALRDRLIDELGLPPELAEQWVRAWEVEAIDRGLAPADARYWDGAWEWIIARRTR